MKNRSDVQCRYRYSVLARHMEDQTVPPAIDQNIEDPEMPFVGSDPVDLAGARAPVELPPPMELRPTVELPPPAEVRPPRRGREAFPWSPRIRYVILELD
jgi:hypothetical protein